MCVKKNENNVWNFVYGFVYLSAFIIVVVFILKNSFERRLFNIYRYEYYYDYFRIHFAS